MIFLSFKVLFLIKKLIFKRVIFTETNCKNSIRCTQNVIFHRKFFLLVNKAALLCVEALHEFLLLFHYRWQCRWLTMAPLVTSDTRLIIMALWVKRCIRVQRIKNWHSTTLLLLQCIVKSIANVLTLRNAKSLTNITKFFGFHFTAFLSMRIRTGRLKTELRWNYFDGG